MHAPPTLRDVARLAGVSTATVSNVLRDHPRVAETTRERVRAAVAQLGYQPNPMARSLRSGRSGSIGLVMPGLRNAYFAELAGEVIRAASAYDLSVSVEILDGDRAHEVACLNGPRTVFTDGLVYVPNQLIGDEIDAAVRPDLPLVLLGERGVGSRFDRVEYRNLEASQAATRHLLERGCRRIVALGPHERRGSATPRLEGYLAAHREAGVPVHAELIRDVPLWHRQEGARAVTELLWEATPFDGVFAFNDMLALGAIRSLALADRRVPGNVKVIGFDALEESAYSLPNLSTIDPGKREAADLAMKLLTERIESRSRVNDGTVVSPDFTLIVRGSTAG